MELKNKETTKNVLTRLQSVYDYMLKKPDEELDEFNRTFALIVDDVDPDALMAAAIQWMTSDNPFHPKPGELRKMALAIGVSAKGVMPLPDSVQAWADAQRYASEVMRRRNYTNGYFEVVAGELVEVPMPTFHPAVIDVVRAIGVERVFYCNTEDASEAGTLAAQFRDAFNTVRVRAEHTGEIQHPLIEQAISAVAAKLRAPKANNAPLASLPSVSSVSQANVKS